MSERSHIDMDKFNSVPSGRPFEYKDVVMESFQPEKRTVDGKKFKAEVENGEFEAIITGDDTDRVQYEKL